MPTVKELTEQAETLGLDVPSDANKSELEELLLNADPDLAAGKPFLVSGGADTAVHELGRRLAKAGYDNGTANGLNPFGIVDESIIAAVAQFRQDHQVPDEDVPAGVVQRSVIGVRTWAALIRATN